VALNNWTHIFFGMLIVTCHSAYGDDARPAYLELLESDKGIYDVQWKRPEISGRVVSLTPVYPAQCHKLSGLPERSVGNIRVENYHLDCGSAGLSGGHIGVKGLEKSRREVLLKIVFTNYSFIRILRPASPSLLIEPAPNNIQVIKDYLQLGVVHIISGVDHLLFVLALLFLVANLSSLVKAVTAFTLSHSLTLVGTVLGWVTLPQAAVEAVIALSILFLAVEIMHKRQGKTSITIRRPWLAALFFGLIHGFGFAGALAETGLPQGDIPLALLCFNLGVELGQLLFVIPVFALLQICAHLNWRLAIERIAGYGIGAISVYWLISRIALF